MMVSVPQLATTSVVVVIEQASAKAWSVGFRMRMSRRAARNTPPTAALSSRLIQELREPNET